MDWQQITALAIVAATAAILAWSRLRRKKFSFQRHTHCGCVGGRSGGETQQSSIVFHARKGEQPRMIVKMK